MMEFNAQTRLRDILAAYPWLPETVVKLDKRFAIINTPIGKALIRNATLGDASRKSGFPLEEIISELRKLIAQRESGGQQGEA